MKTQYKCSHCNNHINVGEDIVLLAKNDVGDKGLVFLHTSLGNYSSKFNSEFEIQEGAKVKFSCPICHHNLTNRKHDNLAHFILIDENEKQFDIVFSKIYGEQCTYKMEEHEIIDTYGEHWSRYQDPDWFLLL